MYLIIINQNITIPGDERSRTDPGHGYPEEKFEYEKVIRLETKDEAITFVKSLGKLKYEIYHASRMTLATVTKWTLEEQ